MSFPRAMTAFTKLLGPKTTASLGALVCYMALCRGLRYLRRNRKHAQYPYKTRADFSKMTGEHAWEITKYVMALEFPYISSKALGFALFRTYGIPSISKLLCETKQLSEVQYAGRRYADTSVLIVEFLAFSPTSERANSAIARVNYLHSRYRKAGKISNDDMLYTLSLFVLELEKWIRLYEWRSLTPMEICAIGTHWKSIGDAMGIQYDGLAHGPSNFRDGLEFFEDIKLWADAYERRAMVPYEWNHKLADETVAILTVNVPGFLKPFAKNIVVTLMDDRLRRAMIYEDPPTIYPGLVSSIIEVRKIFSRYLLLPRPYALRYSLVPDHPDPRTGRFYTNYYEHEPWYMKPTFLARNSLLSWFRWAIGRPYPDGKNYKPEGYLTFEIGPKKMEKLGHEECRASTDRLMAEERGGCPFGFS